MAAASLDIEDAESTNVLVAARVAGSPAVPPLADGVDSLSGPVNANESRAVCHTLEHVPVAAAVYSRTAVVSSLAHLEENVRNAQNAKWEKVSTWLGSSVIPFWEIMPQLFAIKKPEYS